MSWGVFHVVDECLERVACERAAPRQDSKFSGDIFSLRLTHASKHVPVRPNGLHPEWVPEQRIASSTVTCEVPKVGASLRAGRIEFSTAAPGALGPPG
jgi:hypothetical protein